MLYLIPTKKGIGVEIWGTYEDLDFLYDFIDRFWTVDGDYKNIPGEESRNIVISSFSYEIRKAKQGARLVRSESHLHPIKNQYLGCQITWVHLLFTLSCIKFNMQFDEVDKLERSHMLLLEYWIEESMKEYDPVGAKDLVLFTQNVLYGGNPYIYHYMRSIDIDYLLLGGGKRAFRKLAGLLEKGIIFTSEYEAFEKFLVREAKRLKCDISNLEINDEEVDYEYLQW